MEENEIKIGDQTWTTKNLDVDTYRNGDVIPQVQDEEEWKNLTTGAWCYYENESDNGTTYGKLYNWFAVNDPRGLAQKGYHIPSDAEWTILTENLGDKAIIFHFCAGGCRTEKGDFSRIDSFFYCWSSSESIPNRISNWANSNAWSRYFYSFGDRETVNRLSSIKQSGRSVLCLKGELSPEQLKWIKEKTIAEEAREFINKKLMEENEIKIGDQTWITKNLDVDTYRNGDVIPEAEDEYEWESFGYGQTGAWCYYENESANGTTYGKLYNWYAVNDPRGLAPKGYHIPEDEEWTILIDNLGGTTEACTKMKSTSGWKENGNGNNSSGFNGLPGGFCFSSGNFSEGGETGNWWTSTEEEGGNEAFYIYLDIKNGERCGEKSIGYSVRCLRD